MIDALDIARGIGSFNLRGWINDLRKQTWNEALHPDLVLVQLFGSHFATLCNALLNLVTAKRIRIIAIKTSNVIVIVQQQQTAIPVRDILLRFRQ
jgi:hypothetical protein